MRGAERVVDVDVGERGERARTSGSFFSSSGVEAQVLEQHDLGRRAMRVLRPRVAPARRRSRRRTPPSGEQLDEVIGDRLEAEYSGVGLPFGRPRCEREDHRRARLERVADRRQRRA